MLIKIIIGFKGNHILKFLTNYQYKLNKMQENNTDYFKKTHIM